MRVRGCGLFFDIAWRTNEVDLRGNTNGTANPDTPGLVNFILCLESQMDSADNVVNLSLWEFSQKLANAPKNLKMTCGGLIDKKYVGAKNIYRCKKNATKTLWGARTAAQTFFKLHF